MDIKVSVIIPIYNVEQYLAKCLDSMVDQTFREMEVILVNDASPDNSDRIMKEYSDKYPELFRCLYLKENVRQGGARNRGLEIAQGEYVCFVDSDDWVNPDYVKSLYEEAVRSNSDIVYCRYALVNEDSERICADFFPQQIGEQTKERKKIALLLNATGPCWCIIKKSLLVDNKLYFPEKMLYEDMAICPIIPYYAEKMGYTDNAVYYYYQHSESTVHKQDADFQTDEGKAILYLLDQMEKRGIAVDFPTETEAVFTKYFYAWGMNACFDEKFTVPPVDYLNYLADIMKKRYPRYWENPYFFGNIEPRHINHMIENDRRRFPDTNGLDIENVDYSNFYLQDNIQNKINDLSDFLSGKKTALWGAGKKGTEFLQSCKNGFVDIVLDRNPKLIGTKLETGQPVVSPKEGLSEAEVVLIPNKNHYASICESIKESGMKVMIVNLDIYFLFDLSPENCLERRETI